MMNVLRAHGRKIMAGFALAGVLGLGGMNLYQRFAANDCCYPGSPCCAPGSPCCNHGATAQR